MVPAWIQGGNSIKKLRWYAIVNSKNGNRALGINHPSYYSAGTTLGYFTLHALGAVFHKYKKHKTKLSFPFIHWHVAVWTGSLWNSAGAGMGPSGGVRTASNEDNRAIKNFLNWNNSNQNLKHTWKFNPKHKVCTHYLRLEGRNPTEN